MGIGLVNLLVINIISVNIKVWVILDNGEWVFIWMLVIVFMVVFVLGKVLNNFVIILVIFCFCSLWFELCFLCVRELLMIVVNSVLI